MDRLREGKISKMLLARIHISVLCLDRMNCAAGRQVDSFLKVPSARLVAFVSTAFEALDEQKE